EGGGLGRLGRFFLEMRLGDPLGREARVFPRWSRWSGGILRCDPASDVRWRFADCQLVPPADSAHQPPFRPRRRRRRLAARAQNEAHDPLRVFVSIQEAAEAGLTGFRTIQVCPKDLPATLGEAPY